MLERLAILTAALVALAALVVSVGQVIHWPGSW
jgi:hypothetical protein